MVLDDKRLADNMQHSHDVVEAAKGLARGMQQLELCKGGGIAADIVSDACEIDQQVDPLVPCPLNRA